ncbi:MAG: DUF222 domain-containing protein [Actinomycetota bacterium]|nr:DUF222 domain-containing protein [Actinomycetota bacterium]
MIDRLPGGGATAALPRLDTAALLGWVAQLSRLDRQVDDAERVDQLRVLEELKAAAAAAQARVTVDFETSQREQQAAAGVPAGEQGRGVAAQVGLARRDSPLRGSRHLGLARALVTEMPHTLAALSAGWLSEWRATLLVRETACLSREHRAVIDAELAGDPARLAGVGDQALVAAAKRLAYRLDPHAAVRRLRKAESERNVTCRPAPDTMAYLTGLLPVAQAVAAHSALRQQADKCKALGDPRSRGQIMADTLVERLTGQASASAVGVEVQLLVGADTLLGGGAEPAQLHGYGPVPAGWARDLVTHPQAEVWVRRLYTAPGSGDLVAMDSKRRRFTGNLRRFLIVRDQRCRTPWCDAPIRHADHLTPHHAGGPTSASNGQGLCERCNHDRQAPGWRAEPGPGSRRVIEVTTPTGHTYRSHAPPPPQAFPPCGVERRLAHLLQAS